METVHVERELVAQVFHHDALDNLHIRNCQREGNNEVVECWKAACPVKPTPPYHPKYYVVGSSRGSGEFQPLQFSI